MADFIPAVKLICKGFTKYLNRKLNLLHGTFYKLLCALKELLLFG